MIFYRLAGLVLRSERAIPYLSPLVFTPEGESTTVDVEISFAGLTPVSSGSSVGRFTLIGPRQVDFAADNRLRIRIEDGCRMIVDAAPDVRGAEIQTYLFGPAFAALLYQRGMPVLHAGVVSRQGAAVAIAGHSGAGKSTTVRALLRSGYDFLCDDQMLVDASSGLVLPGYPSMKLWRGSAEFFGDPTVPGEEVRAGLDKFHLKTAHLFHDEAVPLRAFFLLVPDRERKVPGLRRLPVSQAVAALGSLFHHAYVADAMGLRPLLFRHAAEIAGRIPVFALYRPHDLSALDALVRLIEETREVAA